MPAYGTGSERSSTRWPSGSSEIAGEDTWRARPARRAAMLTAAARRASRTSGSSRPGAASIASGSTRSFSGAASPSRSGELADRLVAARADRAEDVGDVGADLGERRRQRAQRARPAPARRGRPIRSARSSSFSLTSRSPPGGARRGRRPRSRGACGRRGWRRVARCETAISWRTSRSFSASVRPVSTRSTMPSASPTSGASSTEPLTSITSAERPAALEVALRRSAGTWSRSASRPGGARPRRAAPRRCGRRGPSGSSRSAGRAARR